MGNEAATRKTVKRRFRNCIGPAIRRLRTTRQWTQADLAVKLQLSGLNLDRTDVAKIEGQLRSVYDFELFVLAAVLDAKLSDLHPGATKLKKELLQLREGFRQI